MTITKALRKLYKVIVGEEAPANANTITKVLLALAEAWTGSGGGSGGGGAEPLIVSLTPTGEDDAILSKTWQEIYDAMSQGRTAFIVFANVGNETVKHYPIIEASLVGTIYSVYFITRNNETTSLQVFGCRSADEQPSARGGGGY